MITQRTPEERLEWLRKERARSDAHWPLPHYRLFDIDDGGFIVDRHDGYTENLERCVIGVVNRFDTRVEAVDWLRSVGAASFVDWTREDASFQMDMVML